MSEQIDVAVDLGAIPPPLPGIVTLRQFAATAVPAPPQIINGVLHQGGKMILGGTSKSNKSWSLMDLALSIASGEKWWGHPTTKGNVLYLNAVCSLFRFHPVRQHCHAERACGRDNTGIRRERFLRPLDVHTLPLFFLHPHPTASRAAAESLAP